MGLQSESRKDVRQHAATENRRRWSYCRNTSKIDCKIHYIRLVPTGIDSITQRKQEPAITAHHPSIGPHPQIYYAAHQGATIFYQKLIHFPRPNAEKLRRRILKS